MASPLQWAQIFFVGNPISWAMLTKSDSLNFDLSSCLWLFMVIRCFFIRRAVDVDNLLPCRGRYFLVSTRK